MPPFFSMFWKRGPICLVLSFIYLEASIAVESNRTIDDTLGDSITGKRPNYLPPSGVWENAACKDCVLQPDGILAFKGTWAAATYDPSLNSMSIELAFKGTAIYIFFILANIVEQGLSTETACNFTLDGQPAGSFTHTPASSNEFLYNSMVFSQHDLPNVDHQFSISTSGLNRSVWVNFDYAVYTADDAPSPPQSSSLSSSSKPLISPQSSTTLSTQSSALPTSSQSSTPSSRATNSESPSRVGAIAGGIVGGFATFFAIFLLFLFCRGRKRNAERNKEEFPVAVSPSSAGHQYNDSNARFITPFINPHWRRPDSDNRTLTSHPNASYQGAPMTAFSPSTTIGNSYYSNTAHRTWDPTLMPVSASGQIMASIGTGEGSTPSSASPALIRTSLNAPQDQITEVLRDVRQTEHDRQLRAATEMRDSRADLYVTTARRQTPITSEGRSEEVEMSDMREQIRMMKKQIEYLQTQQQTSAHELLQGPPPDYSTGQLSVHR